MNCGSRHAQKVRKIKRLVVILLIIFPVGCSVDQSVCNSGVRNSGVHISGVHNSEALLCIYIYIYSHHICKNKTLNIKVL